MKRILLALALALVAAQTLAASLTFSDPACAQFALSGAPPNQTLACVSGGTPPPPPPPPPPISTTPGLERFDAASSDWARWQFWQSSEFVPLQARLVATRGWSPGDAYTRINTQINAYGSTIHLQGVKSGALGHETYQCVTSFTPWGTPVFTLDTGGGENQRSTCDAWVAGHVPNALPLGPLK